MSPCLVYTVLGMERRGKTSNSTQLTYSFNSVVRFTIPREGPLSPQVSNEDVLQPLTTPLPTAPSSKNTNLIMHIPDHSCSESQGLRALEKA